MKYYDFSHTYSTDGAINVTQHLSFQTIQTNLYNKTGRQFNASSRYHVCGYGKHTHIHTVAKIWPGPLFSMYRIPAVNTTASATGSPGVVKFGRVLRKRRSHPFWWGLEIPGCCPISIIAITPWKLHGAVVGVWWKSFAVDFLSC